MRELFKRSEADNSLQIRHLLWARRCALSVLTIGLLVLIGWQWTIGIFRRPVAGLTDMNPLTALNLIFTALSFLMLSPSGAIPSPSPVIPPPAGFQRRKRQIAGQLLAAAVLMIALFRIASAIWPAGADPRQQMALSAAGCFLLTGLSLLLLDRKTKGGRLPAQFIAVPIGMMGLFSLVGYLYRVHEFYGVFRYTPMAIYTAGCFLLISLMLLFRNADAGILKEFTSSMTGGLNARQLLPLVILLPIGLGYLRLWGYWKELFSVEFGVAALILSIVFIFVTLIWYNSRLLNKRETLKMESEITLQHTEERYRLLVSGVKDYAIFMLDPSGMVMSWNEGAKKIKGYMADEIIGQHMSVFYTKEATRQGEPADNLASARANGRFEMDGWRVRKDGSLFWANILITALYDPKGALMGFAELTRDITEKRQAEEQIAYMARLLEDTSDAIFSTDIDYTIRTWNKAAEQLFGYSLAETKGKNAVGILRTQMTEELRKSIRADLVAGGYWKGEVNYLNKDNSILTILLSASRVRDAEGELDGFVFVCRDFTENKKLEKKLELFNRDLGQQVKEKTAQLTGIFERITDAFVAMDRNLCYTYVNKRAGQLIHRDPASLIGKCVWDVFPDAIGSDTYLAFNKAMAGQEIMTITDYYAPLELWQENHVYPSPDGLSVFIRDMTEDKRREKEITDYKYAIDQSSIVSITDQNGIIRHVNENFCNLSKYSAEELIGRDHGMISSGFHPPAFIEGIWQIISSGQTWSGEFCNKAKDGSFYWVNTTIVPFLNKKKQPYEYLALGNDITERKTAEASLQRSFGDIRQLAAHLQEIREEERAGIAREIHDELGQQLTGIKMDLSWISRKMSPEESDEVRQKARSTLDLLDTTINTVRKIATNLRPGILDDLGLIAAIEWQSQEFAKRSGIPTEFISGLSEFHGSPAIAIGLFRICQESLTNIARHSQAHHAYISLQEKEDLSIQLEIKDDGKGFQPDRIGAKKTLGLLGMKERVLMMGGDFGIVSQPGQGTTLTVTVPASKPVVDRLQPEKPAN